MLPAFLLICFVSVPFGPPPAADRPPTALVELREAALAVYTPVVRGDWASATERLTAIDTAMADLPARTGKADLRQQLTDRILALRQDVRDHSVAGAATNANWIARLADEMSTSYDTVMPADVRLLGFFGRALEIDGLAPGRPHATAHLADLRTIWRRVEPSVLRRNGVDAARRFGDALAQLDATVSQGDLTTAARAELAAADQITAVFNAG